MSAAAAKLTEVEAFVAATFARRKRDYKLKRIPIAELRHAIGLSALRVWMALLLRRSAEGWTTCTDVSLSCLKFALPDPTRGELGWHEVTEDQPGEKLTRGAIRWARKRLRDFGLSRNEEQTAINDPELNIPIEVWLREILGERDGSTVWVPDFVAKACKSAWGLGGARPGSGGARPGAGRPRLLPHQRKPRKSRAKPKVPAELCSDPDEVIAQLEAAVERAREDAREARRERRAHLRLVRSPQHEPAQSPNTTTPQETKPTMPRRPPKLTVIEPDDMTESPGLGLVERAQARSSAPLLLRGGGLPPEPVDSPVVEIPPPPRFVLGQPLAQQERLLRTAFEGAWRARSSRPLPADSRAMLYGGGKAAAARKRTIKLLLDAELSPFTWCAWALDLFQRLLEPGDDLPSAWVLLSETTIRKHAQRCASEITILRRRVDPPASVELYARWQEVVARARFARTPEERRAIVGRLLPRSKYRELTELARAQAREIEDQNRARAARGEWIWG